MVSLLFPEDIRNSLMNVNEEDDMTQYFPYGTTTSAMSSSMYIPVSNFQQQQHIATSPPLVSSSYQPTSHDMIPDYSPTQFWDPLHTSPQPQYSLPAYSVPSLASLAPSHLVQPMSACYLDQNTFLSRSSSTSSTSGYQMATADDYSMPRYARSVSPGSPDLRAYGFQNKNGTWTCAYPGCTSRAVFTRGCDLRKHHKRHTKSYFCSHESCPQSSGGGFSSKKDLARHMASHQPSIVCEWEGCDRVFSRVDNMRDHVKRIHMKGPRSDSSKNAVS